MRRWLAASAAVACLLLAGCSGGDRLFGDPLADVVRGVQGGECFAQHGDRGFDITREVECSREHVWEVVGTVPLPEGYADADYADLLGPSGALLDDVFRPAMRQCVPMVAKAAGLTAALDGADPLGPDAMVWPGFSGGVLVVATPPSVWAEAHALLCAIEWRGADGRPAAVTSEDERPAIASFTQAGPPERRVCRSVDASGVFRTADCARPHDAEFLFSYDAAVHGPDFVARVAPGAVAPEDWAVLDAACWAAAPGVFGADRTLTDVAIIADVDERTWGAGPLGADSHRVACMAMSSQPGQRLDGPVWGLGDEPAALVAGP